MIKCCTPPVGGIDISPHFTGEVCVTWLFQDADVYTRRHLASVDSLEPERRGGFAESSRDDTRPHLMARDNRQHHALDSAHRRLPILKLETSHPMQPFLANVKS
jgi:hypothetical protein